MARQYGPAALTHYSSAIPIRLARVAQYGRAHAQGIEVICLSTPERNCFGGPE
jgi:hypothetical protein